jgi:hypothetical protein
MPATVAECEINQTEWNVAVALAGAGERLYSAEGFVRVGQGITYWHHLHTGGDGATGA